MLYYGGAVKKILVIILTFMFVFSMYASEDFIKYKHECIVVMEKIHNKWIGLINVLKKIRNVRHFYVFRNELKKAFFELAKESVELRKIVAKIPEIKQKAFLKWAMNLKKNYIKTFRLVRKEKQRILQKPRCRRAFRKLQNQVTRYKSELFSHI